MIIGVAIGIWDLYNEILSQIPSIILLPSILALFLFAFAGKILAKLKRQIGDPDSFEKGVHHYNSRNGIPFQKILDKVTDTIDMSALTFIVIRYSNLSLIEQKLKKRN